MSQKKPNISTNDVSITPNGKKLIQARLPFKTLATTPKGSDLMGTVESRKRKLSPNAEDDNRSIKLIKTSGTTKENIEKTGEVTVQEMVDLVDSSLNDVDMKDNEKVRTIELTKQTKKSTKSKNVEGNEVFPRRSSRKHDSEMSTKVVIKIPSSKKKKVNGRQEKVNEKVLKIDEEEDDDDVIPIDSEENSLISVDGKEKSVNDKVDLSIILLDDDSSVVSDDKVTGSKNGDEMAKDSVTSSKVGDVSNTKTVESDNTDNAGSVIKVIGESVISVVQQDTDKENQSDDNTIVPKEKVSPISDKAAHIEKTDLITTTEENETSGEGHDTNTIDPSDVITIDSEENILPSSDKAKNMEQDETNVVSAEKVDNLLTNINENFALGNQVEAKMDTKFDERKVSSPTTSTVDRPKRKSIDDSKLATTPKTPALKVTDDKALTPKQLQKKLESEQKRLAKEKAKEDRERKIQEAKEERERKIQEAKEERERKLQEEKEQRQRERDEKERQKKKERDDKEEQKRKEREDKEELRRKEKDEREKKKQAETDAKNEEKKQKEEEKRLKEEERVAKEEAEIKKKRKEAEAFTKFFAKKSNKLAETDKMDVDEVEAKLNFMPFRVKDDMRLAPIRRRKLSPTSKTKFDSLVLNSTNDLSQTDLYVQSLRKGNHISEKQGKTWQIEDANDDLMIIDDLEGATPIEETSSIQKYRAKFFKFEENRRPPYYGTWQKKSSVIKPRRPFVTDVKFFDYEIDSDDEWEDEVPGESLHGSDDEKDKESDDDYDIDNDFFVPHGHLSDEELANNDEIDDDNSPDTQKAKLKIMQKVFSDEMKKKTEKIKPRLIGLIWQNKDGSQPQGCPNVIWDMLQMRSMIFNGPSIMIPVIPSSILKNDQSDDISDGKKNSTIKKRVKLTEDVVADLIRLVNGNTNNIEFLSKEFRAFTAEKNKDNDKFQEFSLTSIRHKIKELAEWKSCPEEGPMMNKYCWYVTPEMRKQHSIEDLSIVNDWKYILTPKTRTKTDVKKVKETDKGKSPPEAKDEVPSSNKTPKSKLGNIVKFAKVLSADDRKKKFAILVQEPVEVPSPKLKSEVEPSQKPVKKRVKLLMSVPRGQDIPTQTKNSLISQYLNSANANKKPADNDEPICID